MRKGDRSDLSHLKITLCGSTRFRDQYVNFNRALSKAGHTVYSVSFYGSEENLDSETKETLDLVHLRKILESDAIVIIEAEAGDPKDVAYQGHSTRREKEWASMLNKMIFESHRYGHDPDRLVARLRLMPYDQEDRQLMKKENQDA